MRRFTLSLVSFACVLAGTVGVASGADAAETSVARHFDLKNGNTYTTGTVTFFNRAVRVAGEQKAVTSSGCRETIVNTYGQRGEFLAAAGSGYTCNGSRRYDFVVNANAVGGAHHVIVELWYAETTAGANGRVIADQWALR